MQRVLNWDIKLMELALAVVGQPFTWGETDCASLVRRAMTEMYGEDPWAGAFAGYDSLLSAQKALRDSGGVAAQLRALKAEEIPRNFLQQGDVLIAPPLGEDFADNVFLMVGDQLLSATVEEGVVMRPLGTASEEAYILRMPYGW